MPRHIETIAFDVTRLRRDLSEKAPKWGAFSAMAKQGGTSVSYDIYRRAKNEGCATLASLSAIAKILGYPPSRYMVPPSYAEDVAYHLDGKWIAIYQERPAHEIVRTWEYLSISQRGHRIRGEYDYWKTDDPDAPKRESIYKMRAHLTRDIISGSFWAGGRRSPDGIGVFQLKLRPSAMVADGYCSFYGDDGAIAVSRNLWIKADGSAESTYQLQVAERLLIEKTVYFEIPSFS